MCKHFHQNVHNSQELERAPMPIENKMDTFWYIYTTRYYTIIKIKMTTMKNMLKIKY